MTNTQYDLQTSISIPALIRSASPTAAAQWRAVCPSTFIFTYVYNTLHDLVVRFYERLSYKVPSWTSHKLVHDGIHFVRICYDNVADATSHKSNLWWGGLWNSMSSSPLRHNFFSSKPYIQMVYRIMATQHVQYYIILTIHEHKFVTQVPKYTTAHLPPSPSLFPSLQGIWVIYLLDLDVVEDSLLVLTGRQSEAGRWTKARKPAHCEGTEVKDQFESTTLCHAFLSTLHHLIAA